MRIEVSADATTSTAELVITPPNPFGAYFADKLECRMTIGVLTQLIAQARQTVLLSAPFLQPGFGIPDGPITDAVKSALKRGVDVSVLSTVRGLHAIAVDDLRQASGGCLRLFSTAANMLDAQQLGSHAKFCLVDSETAYVGSANFTGPGLGRHLELGLLVSGEAAQKIDALWKYGLEIGLFIPYAE